MKKLLLATVISALSISAAQAAPKVYGKLFVSTDYVNAKDAVTKKVAPRTLEDSNTWKVNSNASRFGIKGEDELTPTLSAVYQIEWGVDATDGATLTNRNRFLGLKSIDLGTIKWGQFDTATKESQNKVDVFNDFAGEALDMKNVLAGEKRSTNVIGYETPEIEGVPVVVNAQLLLDETTNATYDATKATFVANNSKNGASVSVAYKQDGIYAAIATDYKVSNTFATGGTALPLDIIRLTGQFDLGALNIVPSLTIGALYQTAEAHDDKLTAVDSEDAYLLSASYKLPEGTAGLDGLSVFAQYQSSTTSFDTAANQDLDRTQIGAGVAYAYSPKTSLFGYLARQEFDKQTGKVVDSLETNYVGLGLEHKF